jgi:cytochrome P450
MSASRRQALPPPKPLFSDEFVQNPYPTYARLLAEGPVHFVAISGGAWGVWAVFTHADCSALAKDPRLSAKRIDRMLFTLPPQRHAEFSDLVRMLSLWMIFIDPPEHTRLRKLMNQGFGQPAAEALRGHIEEIVDRMIEPLDRLTEADLIAGLAYPMPVRVISELLGVPETMQDSFLRWSAAIAEFNGSPERTVDHAKNAQDAVHSLTDFFRKTVAERRRKRGNDLISLLIDIEAEGEVLTEEELYAQCVMLLFAGHETTRNLIGNGLFSLLREPEKLAELRDNPDLIRIAVEEFLRFESPIQYTARVAREEIELCGVYIPKQAPLLCMLGAANRDPKQFKDPDVLNLRRQNNQHLAFSAGPHFCIGSQLARLEGQVAILKLIQRFPQLHLTAQRPEWSPNFGFRGLKSLPVALK